MDKMERKEIIRRVQSHGYRTTAGVLSGMAVTAALEFGVYKAQASGVGDCLPYFNFQKHHNHEYEVCTAYIFNSAEVALEAFYKFGNDRLSILADSAKHHFETRYWDGPRQTIEKRVSDWPKSSSFTGNEAKETIKLVSVASNLKADRGLVQTHESWKVSSPSGQTLFQETNQTVNATLCRGTLPGHILHEWVVVDFNRDPNFNCIAFDKQNGLKP